MGGVYSPVVAVEGIWMEGGVEEVWGEYIELLGVSHEDLSYLLLNGRLSAVTTSGKQSSLVDVQLDSTPGGGFSRAHTTHSGTCILFSKNGDIYSFRPPLSAPSLLPSTFQHESGGRFGSYYNRSTLSTQEGGYGVPESVMY